MNKLIRSKFWLLAPCLALLVACGGGGGGSTPLATGAFTKTVDGVDTGDNIYPFNTLLSQIVQQLYLASEINGAGFINRLSFRYSGDLGSAVDCPNTTVKLGHTSLTALTTTFANNVEQGQGSQVTVINDATVTIPAGTGGNYFDVPLENSFHYNGVDNLVIEFVRNTACTGTVQIDTMTETERQVDADPIAATGAVFDHLRFTKFNFAGGNNEQNLGGVGSNTYPFSNLTPRTQFLYLASEIDGSGPITGLAFQKNFVVSTAQTYTATIMLGHSTLTTLGDTFAANYSDTPVTVANAVTFSIPAGIPIGEWFWVPLPDGTFSYNGSDNLIVDVTTSAGTGAMFMVRGNIAGRRLFNDIDNTAATGTVDGFILHAKLRFNGGTMDVITDGGVTTFIIPVGGGEFILQILYDSTALGTGGQITSLGFRLGADAVAFDHTDVNLVLGHTTLSALGSASLAANIQSNRTAVFSGTISIPAGLRAGDWVQVALSTPFTYDPTQNLVVQWDVPGFLTSNVSIGHTLDSGRYVGHVEANLGDRTSDVSNTPTGDFVIDIRLILDN